MASTVEATPSLDGGLRFVPTGSEGLDAILGGGFLDEGFYLIQGDPGSGKTTLALQFACAGVQRGEKVLYISIAESRRDLERTAKTHGWTMDGIDLLDLSRDEIASTPDGEDRNTLFYPAEVELGRTTRAMLTEVERVRPKNVIFDGLGELRMLAGDAFTYRRQVLALKGYFEEQGITVLMLDDRSGRNGEMQPETLVGGNILLERFLPGYGGMRRRLSVTKVRGAEFRSGYHDYDLVTGEGVVVYPRLVTDHEAPAYKREIFSSGLPELDKMTGGGLLAGTTTLLMGPAGVGKSTTAMQFMAAALARGVPTAFYAFDEVLDTFYDRADKLCAHNVREYARSGLLRARQVNPAEQSPGRFAQEVRHAVEVQGVRVVVIDSLNGYISAMPEENFLQTHLHELFTYLNQQGVVSLMVVAQHGFLGADIASIDVSYLADTVMLLRYFETGGEILQAISVLKNRTGEHERTLRQLRISSNGLSVGEPLREFRGIMTGVPQYEGN